MIDFALTADAVAPQLLGCTLTHAGVSIRLTEVEAYLGAEDSAAPCLLYTSDAADE